MLNEVGSMSQSSKLTDFEKIALAVHLFVFLSAFYVLTNRIFISIFI